MNNKKSETNLKVDAVGYSGAILVAAGGGLLLSSVYVGKTGYQMPGLVGLAVGLILVVVWGILKARD